MSEEVDKHVLRRFEICQKLGKGVSRVRCARWKSSDLRLFSIHTMMTIRSSVLRSTTTSIREGRVYKHTVH